ncbi:MAG: hypothetical protein CFE34_03835 [Rhodobacteraceae bacterium PARR1]|nr:MAG: hypothetical protein CFE34_03835 [Rhodobacteraceae bacterium PARR1]
MLTFLTQSLVIGIAGTAAMDLWAVILNRLAGQGLPNWGLVGRWFAFVPKGRIFHGDITRTPPVQNETLIGWAAHYAVGIVYGAALVLWAGPEWTANPTFLPAFIVGMVTIAAGWFLLAPGMGAGWAAAKTPNPTKSRLLNIAAHTAFALGMWAGALVIA